MGATLRTSWWTGRTTDGLVTTLLSSRMSTSMTLRPTLPTTPLFGLRHRRLTLGFVVTVDTWEQPVESGSPSTLSCSPRVAHPANSLIANLDPTVPRKIDQENKESQETALKKLPNSKF